MNNVTRSYEKIFETLQSIETRIIFLNQTRKPIFSDIKLIAIDLTSDFFLWVLIPKEIYLGNFLLNY